MAELALPLIGLGILYVVSNNDNKKENYSNMNKKPELSKVQAKYNKSIDKDSDNFTKQYNNPNQTTDKFFNQKTTNSNSNQNINSLSGNNIDKNDFKHNNMVPFFGSKVKGQQIDSMHSKTILDNHQGAGNQHVNKVEQAPLFKPDDNIQFTHGAPNRNDFMQSRQLPSTKISNVIPWKQEQVGPGLGLGSTTEGVGGFNSGMLNRDAWVPPTVDELRVKTNPKSSYNLYGHEGPIGSKVQNPGIEGIIEKNRPDTDYAVGPQHWFTTTGATTGQSSIPEHIIPERNRNSTSNQYFGSGGNDGNSKSSYFSGHYEQSNRPELPANDIKPVSAVGHGSATSSDFGAKSYNILKNNRNANNQENNTGSIGGINGTFKAFVAPIIDVLRPTRKENIIHNANETGNIAALVPNLPITNPNDRVKTTIKETTVDKVGFNHLNVSHVAIPDGGYKNTEIQIKEQERNIGDSSSMGFVGGPSTHEAQMNTTAWNNQRNNVNKTYESRAIQGNMSMLNSNMNIEFGKRDNDRMNHRSYNNDCQLKPPNSMADTVPSLDSYGKINMPQQYSQEVNNDRINPDMLSAFKNNPYAQSVTTY